jgi:hypothetical protein
MHGLSINGFIVVETMGSGRFGNLYLARHPVTGQEAIIRLVSEGENGSTMQVFLDEASSLLAGSHEVKRAPMSDGREALVALPSAANPPAQTVSTSRLPQAPGSGWSEHTNTARSFDQLGPQSTRSNGSLAVLLIGAALLGAGGAALWLASRTPVASGLGPAPGTAVAMQPLADAGSKQAPDDSLAQGPVAKAEEETSLGPGQGVVQDAGPVAQLPGPTAASVRQPGTKLPVSREANCVPNESWRKRMNLDLADLERKATKLSAPEVERGVAEIYHAMKAAHTSSECTAVERRFDALVKHAL